MHPSVQLMIEYMNEHYAAARHHQALRAQTTAFLLSASAVIFGKALDEGPASQDARIIGYALIAIGIVAMAANLAFFRGNRIHSETAAKCRKLLAAKLSGPDPGEPFENPDPVWVRREIERVATFPFYNPDRTGARRLKIEYVLSAVFHLVPALIVGAGLLVLFSGA